MFRRKMLSFLPNLPAIAFSGISDGTKDVRSRWVPHTANEIRDWKNEIESALIRVENANAEIAKIKAKETSSIFDVGSIKTWEQIAANEQSSIDFRQELIKKGGRWQRYLV